MGPNEEGRRTAQPDAGDPSSAGAPHAPDQGQRRPGPGPGLPPVAIRPATDADARRRPRSACRPDLRGLPVLPRPALPPAPLPPDRPLPRVLPARRRRQRDDGGLHGRLDGRGRPLPELPLRRRDPRRPRCGRAAAGRMAAGARDPRHGGGQRGRSRAGPGTPGHGRRPGLAGTGCRAGCWSAPSSTRSAPVARDAAHVVVGADNAGAVSLYERAGFVTVERFELHAGTESLLMQWDRRPEPSAPPPPPPDTPVGHERTADRCRRPGRHPRWPPRWSSWPPDGPASWTGPGR